MINQANYNLFLYVYSEDMVLVHKGCPCLHFRRSQRLWNHVQKWVLLGVNVYCSGERIHRFHQSLNGVMIPKNQEPPLNHPILKGMLTLQAGVWRSSLNSLRVCACVCVPITLYLWMLKMDFHIIFIRNNTNTMKYL